MSRLSTIELFKEAMNFSAGHFTVFSATERENLHGHNYHVHAAFTAHIANEGLAFDYRFYKEKLYALCERLDETVLIPGACEHLSIAEKEGYFHITFHDEILMFLKRDVKILNLTNITVEELSHWFVQEILMDAKELEKNKIVSIHLKVLSGQGQSGSTTWNKMGASLTIPSRASGYVYE